VIYYLIRQVALVFFQPLWPVDDYRDRGIRGIGDGWLRRKRWSSGPNSEDFLAIASPYRLAAAGGKNPEL